jgi:hypothetical protein
MSDIQNISLLNPTGTERLADAVRLQGESLMEIQVGVSSINDELKEQQLFWYEFVYKNRSTLG